MPDDSIHNQVISIAKKLLALKQPDRHLDIEIALLTGYQRKKNPSGRVIWLAPSNGKPTRIPRFTASIDATVDLIKALGIQGHHGCGWEPGMGSARIGDGPFIQAASPEIALCIAALNAYREAKAQDVK